MHAVGAEACLPFAAGCLCRCVMLPIVRRSLPAQSPVPLESLADNPVCWSAQEEGTTPQSTALYRLNRGKGFEKEAAGVSPSFFDVNEDSGSGVPHLWSLEVGDVETEVSDNFSFDPGVPHTPQPWLRRLQNLPVCPLRSVEHRFLCGGRIARCVHDQSASARGRSMQQRCLCAHSHAVCACFELLLGGHSPL